MKNSELDVIISTMEGVLSCTVKELTSVKDLMLYVGETVKVKELYFFGFQYMDSTGYNSWMRLDKKIPEQPIAKESPIRLRFVFRFFPEEIEKEISESSTLRLLYLQVKDMVMTEKLVDLSLNTAVILASLLCHVKFGPYKENINLESETLFPRSLQEKREALQNSIERLWKQHGEMTKTQAMYRYITTVQNNSRMFGKSVFTILKNQKSKEEQLLFVDSQGISIYDRENNNTANVLSSGSPQYVIPWGQIITPIRHTKKRLTIKLKAVSPESKIKLKDIVVYTENRRKTKHIIGLCEGNHKMQELRLNGKLAVTKLLDGIYSQKMESEVSSRINEDTSYTPDNSMKANRHDTMQKYDLEAVDETDCVMEEVIKPATNVVGAEAEIPMDFPEDEEVEEKQLKEENRRVNKSVQMGFWQKVKLRLMELLCFYT